VFNVEVCAIPIHSEGVVDLSGTKTVGHVCYIQALYFREPVHTLFNISVISCRLVLMVEETGVPGENPCPVASH
jgi:hypothetical protein